MALAHQHHCYILHGGSSYTRTYVGYTVDPSRRLRQHNGLIKGGARATKTATNWTFLAIVTSDHVLFNNIMALSVEWHLKHPAGRKKKLKNATATTYWGVQGRLRGLVEVLNRYSIDFTVYVADTHLAYLEDLRNTHEATKDLSDPACNVLNIKPLTQFYLSTAAATKGS